jgi:hypothetical protein
MLLSLAAEGISVAVMGTLALGLLVDKGDVESGLVSRV